MKKNTFKQFQRVLERKRLMNNKYIQVLQMQNTRRLHLCLNKCLKKGFWHTDQCLLYLHLRLHVWDEKKKEDPRCSTL